MITCNASLSHPPHRKQLSLSKSSWVISSCFDLLWLLLFNATTYTNTHYIFKQSPRWTYVNWPVQFVLNCWRYILDAYMVANRPSPLHSTTWYIDRHLLIALFLPFFFSLYLSVVGDVFVHHLEICEWTTIRNDGVGRIALSHRQQSNWFYIGRCVGMHGIIVYMRTQLAKTVPSNNGITCFNNPNWKYSFWSLCCCCVVHAVYMRACMLSHHPLCTQFPSRHFPLAVRCDLLIW